MILFVWMIMNFHFCISRICISMTCVFAIFGGLTDIFRANILFLFQLYLICRWNCNNRNCLGQFHWISRNQTSDVHRGSTLITWNWRYITWRWRQRNHINTITSVAAAKQTVISEVYVFSIKYRYSDILLKIHKPHLFCWLDFSGNQKNGFW